MLVNLNSNWYRYNEIGEYVDYEPSRDIAVGGYSRITLNIFTNTAYATKVNQEAYTDEDASTHSDETVELTWDEAIAILS